MTGALLPGLLLGCVLLTGGAVKEPLQEPSEESAQRTAQEYAVDPRSHLYLSPGHDFVVERCRRCHSLRLITQTSATREQWYGLIRWMQESEDLEEFSVQETTLLLDYLARHYGLEDRPRRRAPLPPELLPPPAR